MESFSDPRGLRATTGREETALSLIVKSSKKLESFFKLCRSGQSAGDRMPGVSENLAQILKTVCRLYLVGLPVWVFWIVWRKDFDHRLVPFLAGSFAVIITLTVYVSFALGVDVVGVGRPLGYPQGKPFEGLRPDERDHLRCNFTAGSIDGLRHKGVFKLRLTNQRLLAGINLTGWHLVEIPLREIAGAETGTRGRVFPTRTLRLTWRGPGGTEQREIGLSIRSDFARLIEELQRLGVPIKDSP